MLSLVDRVEPIDGVTVPDPRGEPWAIVALVTCGPTPATVGWAESGGVSPDGFFWAS